MNTNQALFAKAIADETRQEIMSHMFYVWLRVTGAGLCTELCGKAELRGRDSNQGE
jgi:hypothetical protein